MRIAVCLLLLLGLAGGFAQESTDQHSWEIVWHTPTNHLPKSVWTYKLIAQNFGPAVISNLMILGSFTLADETNLPGQPVSSRYFYSRDGSRQLGIVPTYGYVFYRDSNAERKIREIAVDVPNDEEAYQRGLGYLQKFGIDHSQLVSAGDGLGLKVERRIGKVTWLDQTSGTNVETVYMRSVYFRRQISGYDLTHDGVEFQFGNHGRISKMEIIWRGWEPSALYPTLSADQLVGELRAKRGRWFPSPPSEPVKKVTIFDIQPIYRGFPVRENDDKGLKLLEPIARLKTQIDDGTTNFNAVFECSIYSANRP